MSVGSGRQHWPLQTVKAAHDPYRVGGMPRSGEVDLRPEPVP